MRLLALFVAILLPLPLLAAPNIKAVATTHNFGSVLQGTPVNHSFVVENRGSSPLQILKITPDCGCSAAELPSPFVEAGERTKIDVTFNTSGFFGFKRRTFRVFTNDPRKRYYILSIEGEQMK